VNWSFESWVFFWFAGLAGVLTRDLIFALADDIYNAVRVRRLARQRVCDFHDWTEEDPNVR
jgi:hypothetical protein